MIEPLFSVVIPTYNRIEALPRCLNSILNQSFQNFEIIIIDNGSTDQTKDLISNSFMSKKISYFYQTGSGTPASPRNRGIRLSKGKWICFLDSDDFWHKDKLNSIFKRISRNEEIDVICHNEKYFYEDKKKSGKEIKYGPFSSNFYHDLLIWGNRLSTSATCVKADFLIKHRLNFDENPKLSTVEDYDLWLQLAKKQAKFFFIQKSLGFYSVGETNLISNGKIYCNNLENLFKKHTLEFKDLTRKKIDILNLRVKICKIMYCLDENIFSKFVNLFWLFSKFPRSSLKYLANYFLIKIKRVSKIYP